MTNNTIFVTVLLLLFKLNLFESCTSDLTVKLNRTERALTFPDPSTVGVSLLSVDFLRICLF